MSKGYWQTEWEKDYGLMLKGGNDVYGTFGAFVKFDGCVDLYDKGDVHDEDQSFHICDLDIMIARLQEIKRLAVAKFGEDWGEA